MVAGIIKPRTPMTQQLTPMQSVDIVSTCAVDVMDFDKSAINNLIMGGATITEIEEGKVQGLSN